MVESQFAQPFLVATPLVHFRVGIAEVDGLGDASVLALSDRIAARRGITGRKVAQHHGSDDPMGVQFPSGPALQRFAR